MVLKNLVRQTVYNSLRKKFSTSFNSFLQQNGKISLGSSRSNFNTTSSSFISSLGKFHVRHRTVSVTPFVRHNKREGYFFIDLPGCRAVLEYERELQVVRITNTEVPRKCSGKGYATALAEAAFEWVAKNNLRVIIECQFIEDFIINHKPEYEKYIFKGAP